MFKKETAFGTGAAMLQDCIRKTGVVLAAIKYAGFASARCECGGTIRTGWASAQSQIANGLRFSGVPCDRCERTHTIELVDVPDA